MHEYRHFKYQTSANDLVNAYRTILKKAMHDLNSDLEASNNAIMYVPSRFFSPNKQREATKKVADELINLINQKKDSLQVDKTDEAFNQAWEALKTEMKSKIAELEKTELTWLQKFIERFLGIRAYPKQIIQLANDFISAGHVERYESTLRAYS